MYSFYPEVVDVYGGVILYDNHNNATDTVYDDRLRQWDYKKNDELSLKHFGNTSHYWQGRSSSKVEAFLCDYLGKKVKLCRIIKYKTNSGYDSIRFDFKYR